jgi:hypothetical protein
LLPTTGHPREGCADHRRPKSKGARSGPLVLENACRLER